VSIPADPTEDPKLAALWEKVNLNVSPDEVVAESKLIAEAQREVWGSCMEGVVDLHQPVRRWEGEDVISCSKCEQELN
jgi:hypothetical protein